MKFWELYPRKVSKGAALKAWKQLGAGRPTQATLEAALAWQRTSEDWTRDDGQYIPYPATYLRGQRWLDEPTATIPTYHPASATDADREREDADRRAQIAANRAKPPNIVIVGEQ